MDVVKRKPPYKLRLVGQKPSAKKADEDVPELRKAFGEQSPYTERRRNIGERDYEVGDFVVWDNSLGLVSEDLSSILAAKKLQYSVGPFLVEEIFPEDAYHREMVRVLLPDWFKGDHSEIFGSAWFRKTK